MAHKTKTAGRGQTENEFVVIGLGRFGASLARRLEAMGHITLGIDGDMARVQAIADQDVPTMDLMAAVAVKLRERGVTLMFAQMRGAVRDRLARADLMKVIGPVNTFPSLAAGVDAFLLRDAESSAASGQNGESSVIAEAISTSVPG